VSTIMFIKTLALYSVVYIAGITSSMAVHQVIVSPSAAARFDSNANGAASLLARQIATRSLKSDMLLVKQPKRSDGDKGPVQGPVRIEPSPVFKTDCKPPVDVLGRCFADAGMSYTLG